MSSQSGSTEPHGLVRQPSGTERNRQDPKGVHQYIKSKIEEKQIVKARTVGSVVFVI